MIYMSHELFKELCTSCLPAISFVSVFMKMHIYNLNAQFGCSSRLVSFSFIWIKLVTPPTTCVSCVICTRRLMFSVSMLFFGLMCKGGMTYICMSHRCMLGTQRAQMKRRLYKWSWCISGQVIEKDSPLKGRRGDSVLTEMTQQLGGDLNNNL